MPKSIIIVEGGSWGSESKGLAVAQLAADRPVDLAVRTGSIQAGHTVIYNGKKCVGRTIPVAWVNPKCKLLVGAGAYVNPKVLEEEVAMVAEATGEGRDSVIARLFIDKRAGLHSDAHIGKEHNSGIHTRMGSTGEGVAEAIKDKMDRRDDYQLFGQSQFAAGYQIVDTVKMLNDAYDAGEQILLEGTQGTMLDLHMGDYPFTTSRQTTAAAWATEAGLSPSLEYEVVLVVRTMPIRVAGNSGPLPGEVEWIDLMTGWNVKRAELGLEPLVRQECIDDLKGSLEMRAKEMNLPTWRLSELSPKQRADQREQCSNLYRVALESLTAGTVAELKKVLEMTTVTKKVRRIANLDMDQLKYAIQLNRPSYLCLMFLNYKHPSLFGAKTWADIKASPEYADVVGYLGSIQAQTGVLVKYVNCSPDNMIEVPTEATVTE